MLSTMFSTARTFVTSNFRLMIEYAMIAAVITLAGFSAAMWSQKLRLQADIATVKTSLVTTQWKVATLQFGMSVQEGTIADLKSLRTQDTKALDGLLLDYKALSKKDLTVRTRLKELEKKDETVRTYLNSPIPASLMCLLDNTCEATGTGNKAR